MLAALWAANLRVMEKQLLVRQKGMLYWIILKCFPSLTATFSVIIQMNALWANAINIGLQRQTKQNRNSHNLCIRPSFWKYIPSPWDSPGKNTGVGCHFLLQCLDVKSESEVVQSCSTPKDPMDCSLPGSSVHGIFQANILEWGAIAFSHIFTRSSI